MFTECASELYVQTESVNVCAVYLHSTLAYTFVLTICFKYNPYCDRWAQYMYAIVQNLTKLCEVCRGCDHLLLTWMQVETSSQLLRNKFSASSIFAEVRGGV